MLVVVVGGVEGFVLVRTRSGRWVVSVVAVLCLAATVLVGGSVSAAAPSAGAVSAGATKVAKKPYRFVRAFTAFTGIRDPESMVVSKGRVYAATSALSGDDHGTVRVFTLKGRLVDSWNLGFHTVAGIDVDRAGNLHVGDYDGDILADVPPSVHIYSPSGRRLGGYGAPVTGSPPSYPTVGDVAVGPDGTRYIVDPIDSLVDKFAPDGTYLGAAGSRGSGPRQFRGPWGVTVDRRGFVFIADTGNDRIQVINPRGDFVRHFGRPGRGAGRLDQPEEVRVGPNGHLFVTDRGTRRVQEFTARGRFVRVAATKKLGRNYDLDFDGAGRLYVSGKLASLKRGVAVFAPPR